MAWNRGHLQMKIYHSLFFSKIYFGFDLVFHHSICLCIFFAFLLFVYHAFTENISSIFGILSFSWQFFFILFYFYLPHSIYFNWFLVVYQLHTIPFFQICLFFPFIFNFSLSTYFCLFFLHFVCFLYLPL